MRHKPEKCEPLGGAAVGPGTEKYIPNSQGRSVGGGGQEYVAPPRLLISPCFGVYGMTLVGKMMILSLSKKFRIKLVQRGTFL